MNLLQGIISNHMAGFAGDFSATEVIEMIQQPENLSAHQIAYVREFISHCNIKILRVLASSTGLTMYEWARIMGICEINNRRLAEWTNSYVPEYEVPFYWKRMW